MSQYSLLPLRTSVGNAIPVERKRIQVVDQSEEVTSQRIRFDVRVSAGIAATASREADSEHEHPGDAGFLPTYSFAKTEFVLCEGMDRLPIPPGPRPFADDASVISLFGHTKTRAAGSLSRRLWVTLRITFEKPHLVGGAFYGGLPYLPSSNLDLLETGVNSSNFGLPREVRVTCVGASSDDGATRSAASLFIDSEFATTRQQITSHSGFHFLHVAPTMTRTVELRLADFPRILRRIDVSARGAIDIEEFYGLAIPYLGIYEYQERTRYRPIVSAGLLGTRRSPRPAHAGVGPGSLYVNGSNGIRIAATPEDLGSVPEPDEEPRSTSASTSRAYYDFTAAACMFGQQRRYQAGKTDSLTECFISAPILPSEALALYVEQAEDHERCVAGLRLLMPRIREPGTHIASSPTLLEAADRLVAELDPFGQDSGHPRQEDRWHAALRMPRGVAICKRIGIRVFEVDPPEGVSPISVTPGDKYGTLLAERELALVDDNDLAFFVEGLKFKRPSTLRVFAIELTNRDDKAGQFPVKLCQLMQSAHVVIHPRPARAQQVRSLNFRLIGPRLADDYALLGGDGFNFSIERVVAGERRAVLFCANSLMDLLHTGAARIFSNVRRRAVEYEKSEVRHELPNIEVRQSRLKSAGWRRSELGRSEDVAGVNAWSGRDLEFTGTQRKFESFSAQEGRVRNDLLYPERDNEWNAAARYFNLVRDAVTVGTAEPIVPNHDGRLNRPWRNPAWNDKFTFQPVRGTRNLSISPFSAIRTIEDFFDRISHSDPLALVNLLTVATTTPSLILTSGSSSSLSLSPGGIGASLGISPWPSAMYSVSYGSTGSIGRTATEGIYSYTQTLAHGYDDAEQTTEVRRGQANRKVTRSEVPDTDRERVRGAEVMWQGQIMDIITGTIPLNLELPATATKMHLRTADDCLRVRLGSGVGPSLAVDFWFDVVEEELRDDY